MTRLIALFSLVSVSALAFSAGAQAPKELRNWGRWGADDQRGAANFITPERIASAAQLIQRGAVFNLGVPLDGAGPRYPGRTRPTLTTVVSGADYAAGAAEPPFKFADDYIFMPLQGSTQWDGLSHAWYGDTLYNGVPETAIRGAGVGGATKLGIENIKDSMVGRGVLIDMVAYKGAALAPGYAITAKDLDGALAQQGSRVLPGDIVLVRTGYLAGYYATTGEPERLAYLLGPAAGVGPAAIPWIHEKQIAAMAADSVAFEAMSREPASVGDEAPANLHGALLKDMGVYIGEIWWLEDLAADCAKDGRYEFFLAAQPLHIPGAVGSPINPVAIK